MNTRSRFSFGDYIVFVDESGDHHLTRIDPVYSVFVLAFAIVKKSEYVNQVCRDLQQFKLRWFAYFQQACQGEHQKMDRWVRMRLLAILR